MHSVLIVEDFFIDRENLKEIVDSCKDLGVVVSGACENGLQALEFIRMHEPDIVVSDIEMPGLGGLELGRIVKREYPNIRFVFSTLYDQFKYAKEALELESYGYILKPVDAGELRECLGKVTGLIETQSRHAKEYESLRTLLYESKPELSEAFIKSLVYGLVKDTVDIWGKVGFLGLDIVDGLFALALLEVDDYAAKTAGLTTEQKQILSLQIHERIKKAVAEYAGVLPARLDDAHFAVLFSRTDDTDPAEFARTVSFYSREMLGRLQMPDVTLSVAVSDCGGNILDIGRLYEQCSYILRYKYSLGKGKVLCGGDIQSGAAVPDIDYKELQKEIRFLLNSGGPDELGAYMDSLFADVPCSAGDHYLKNLSFHVAICTQTVLNENNEDFKRLFSDGKLVWEKLAEFETAADAKDFLKRLLIGINGFLGKKASSRNKAISGDVIKYIEKHLREELSLEKIATDLFYSPNYLNNLFKQETGSTIYDYVCRYRMEKAKEMLLDWKLKLYDIAEALGYSHPAYFNNVFKKYTGLTPREFRERGT